MGCIPPTKEKIESFPKVPELALAETMPAVVDLTSNFPVPGDQGQQGSCVAWATAYAYKTFQEKLQHQWSLTTKNHIFSPAYVYNQINGGEDSGAYIDDAMKLFVAQGVCSWAAMPYRDYDYTTQPNTSQRREAAGYKAISWGTIGQGDVNAIKSHIAAGDAIVVGIPVYPDFDNISQWDPVYDDASGTLRGYHAICFVGYDDTKEAFKFINSWGSGWGLNGFGYMSYSLVQQLDIVGYVMTDA